ncbi:MAG: PAS domain S-box protein [Anaerolineales bacterium]|nr:PAS domain S-box protein [Anaerolineales bacterium]
MEKPLVLLAEDETPIAEQLRLDLKSMGYEIAAIVATGEEAVQAALGLRPDLALIDVHLGGEMDGIQAAAQMRAHDDIPVIYLTTHVDETFLQQTMSTGAAGYILKPLSEGHLRMAIEIALYRRSQERKLKESEERHRIISELTSDFAYSFRVDPDGALQPEWVTESFARITGYSVEQANTKGWVDIVHPDDKPGALLSLQKVLSGQPDSGDLRILTSEGEIRWLRIFSRSQWDENQQRVTHVYGGAQDITQQKLAEESHRQSEEKYRSFVENFQGIAFRGRMDFVPLFFHGAVEAITGYTENEFLSGNPRWDQIIHPGDIDRISESLDKICSIPAYATEREYRIIRKDGGVRWVREMIRNVCDRAGNPNFVQGAIHDISDQKRAEEALRESEARFRNYFDLGMIGMTISSTDGKWVEVNDRMCEMLGYSRDELVGKAWTDVTHPEDIGITKLNLERFLAGEIDRYTINKRFIRKDGQVIWTNLSTSCVRRSDGSIEYLIGFIQDTTERVRAETERERLLKQVHEQAQQVREIMNTVPEGVIMIDSNGQILLANPTAQRDLQALSGIQGGGVLQKLGNRPLSKLLTSPPKGLWHEVETDRRTFEVIARPMGNDPKPERWVIVMRDVTHERELQRGVQQQERLAAVGQLAAGIAHDFNNILAVILLYTEIMLGDPALKPEQRQRLGIIAQQARNASHLVQQILDFSRRAVLERMPMDLLPFVKEQARLFERTLPESIRINLSYRSGEYTVNADPTRLQQAIMNLAVNARDAMPNGGDLYIELSRPAPGEGIHCVTCGQVFEGDWFCIRVRDTGCGIPAEALPRIFDPFFTTKTPGQGTGLGLSQVYGIVKQHGGHIDVHSQVDQGAAFSLYLPATPSIRILSPHPDANSLVYGQGQTILLVEDEPATRQALAESLALLGYQVRIATNGQEALNHLETQAAEIDLVLSDVVMPQMGGVALFHNLQEKHVSLPLILMTGHPMQEELDNLRSLGLSAWLLKPPNLKQLSEVIARILE